MLFLLSSCAPAHFEVAESIPIEAEPPDEDSEQPTSETDSYQESVLESIPGVVLEPDDEPIPKVEPVAIFDDTVLHTFAITVGDEEIRLLKAEPYEWVTGEVVIDGEYQGEVGLRLRGKIGSFREFDQKPKFKIDFNQYDPDNTFQGLESISLNNSVVDCSYLKEPAGFAIYAQLGMRAPRVSFAHVTVNGANYGLYVVAEVPDDTFLKDRFEEPDGNLYDGKYLYYGDWDYEMVDFTSFLEDNFQLEEGVDVGKEDIYAITDATQDFGASFNERLGDLMDIPNFHRNLMAEQWIGHLDGYALNTNNYRVYFNPWDNRMEFIPWDLDYAFLEAWDWGFSWSRPKGTLVDDCFDDEECVREHRQYVAAAIATVDTAGLLERVTGWRALIAEEAANDPKRECASASVQPTQDEVEAWVAGGAERMEDAW
jgi:hypothetical protein